jgi:hypothetical protein
MVWEETPGWGYLGDDAWKEIVAQNVHDIVMRDRNRPSIVIWGVRVNESRNDVPLYVRTTEIAKTLDGTRPCSGSMTPGSMRTWKEQWREDVFAFDDYHAEEDGTVGIREPLPGVAYMLAEAVGQFNYTARKGFDAKYVRTSDPTLLQAQAVRHAQAHDRARAYPRCSGVIAWCAFDYSSLINAHHAIKTPGVGRRLPHSQAGRGVLSIAGEPEGAARKSAGLLLGLRRASTERPRQQRRDLFQLRPAGGFHRRQAHRHGTAGPRGLSAPRVPAVLLQSDGGWLGASGTAHPRICRRQAGSDALVFFGCLAGSVLTACRRCPIDRRSCGR